MKRRVLLQGAAGAALLAGGSGSAMAQSRAETLRYVTGATINTLDTTMFGATRESFGLSMNVYDRLFTFGRKKVADYWVFDPAMIRGELVYCRTEQVTGTMFKKERCASESRLLDEERRTKDALNAPRQAARCVGLECS